MNKFIKKIISIITILLMINFNSFAKNKTSIPKLYLEVNNTEEKIKLLLKNHSLSFNHYLKEYSKNDFDYLSNESSMSFKKFLNSHGYLNAKVECSYDITNDNLKKIMCKIELGEIFLLKEANLVLLPKQTSCSIIKPDLEKMGVKINSPVKANNILQIQKNIDNFIEDKNSLLDLETTHIVTLNKENSTAKIDYLVSYGPEAYLQNITFSGLTKTKPEYALYLSSLTYPGQFKKNAIIEARNKINASGILSVRDVIIPPKPNEKGGVVIQFNVKEQKTKTGKIGLQYNNDFGLSLNSSFINRNLFGMGKKLTTELMLSNKIYSFNTLYNDNWFLKKEQKLILQNLLKSEKNKSYISKELSIGAGIEKELFTNLTGGIKTNYSIAKVKSLNENKISQFFSLPLFLLYSNKDNYTDPIYGFSTKFEFTPYLSLDKKNNNFFKNYLSSVIYFPISTTKKNVIALRGNIGHINIKNLNKIPINERFFSGGSNSIRGYKYQVAGPLDDDGKPKGGISLLEFSAELRHKINEEYGAIIFTDMGNVFNNKISTNLKNLFISVGIGIRYYTKFGPIRLDIAFPIPKKRKIDNSFQMYFSIGQAF